jgi:hypothetical protein
MPLSRKEQPRCLIIMGVDIGKSLYAPNNGLHLTTYPQFFKGSAPAKTPLVGVSLAGPAAGEAER